MRIGILGGTFSPIHYGHLILAETAYDRFCLDKVLFMPAGNPYFKELGRIVSKNHREQMVKLAIQDNDHFEFNDLELNKSGNTYTYDTLESLHKMNPEDDLYFIVGSDSLFSLEKWYKIADIFELATILTSCRNNEFSNVDQQIRYLKNKYSAKIFNLYMPDVDISSTDLRDKIKHGMSIKYLTPDAVIEYIKDNNLYLE